MEATATVSPVTGQRLFMFGGRHQWKYFEHRGYIVSLEWVRQLHHRKNPPRAMCIWPAGHVLAVSNAGDRGTWVINSNDLVNMVGFNADGKCTGSGSAYLIREAHEALAVMGKDPNDRQALLGLIDCVIRFAEDLARMPRAPRATRNALAGEPIFELTHTDKNSGKTIHEGAA